MGKKAIILELASLKAWESMAAAADATRDHILFAVLCKPGVHTSACELIHNYKEMYECTILIDRRVGSSSVVLQNWRETRQFKLGIHLAELLNNQGCCLWPVVPNQRGAVCSSTSCVFKGGQAQGSWKAWGPASK